MKTNKTHKSIIIIIIKVFRRAESCATISFSSLGSTTCSKPHHTSACFTFGPSILGLGFPLFLTKRRHALLNVLVVSSSFLLILTTAWDSFYSSWSKRINKQNQPVDTYLLPLESLLFHLWMFCIDNQQFPKYERKEKYHLWSNQCGTTIFTFVLLLSPCPL